MSDSFVTSVDLTTDNAGKTQITLTVQVDGFEENETVEIFGQATQENGAFANYYATRVVPEAVPGADGVKHQTVTVTTEPLPQHPFVANQSVTVALRVAKVWVTVLGAGLSASDEQVGSMQWAPPAVVASIDGSINPWPQGGN